MRAETR